MCDPYVNHAYHSLSRIRGIFFTSLKTFGVRMYTNSERCLKTPPQNRTRPLKSKANEFNKVEGPDFSIGQYITVHR